jgi:TRAP-type C4-dicarboxylate transport system permease small subunit
MTGVPMWVPHGVVVLGFGLILIVAAWSIVRLLRGLPERASAAEAQP